MTLSRWADLEMSVQLKDSDIVALNYFKKMSVRLENNNIVTQYTTSLFLFSNK